jgi:hypothetical protein
MHTKDKLAEALRAAGLNGMADKAATGYYHDYLSPLDAPCVKLAEELNLFARAPSNPRRAEAQALLERHLNGDFDASPEESEAWANSPEGREAFAMLTDAPKQRDERPQGLEAGRLAMRVQGDWWVAYYALSDTMEGAIELARVRMSLMENPDSRDQFLNAMRDVLGRGLAQVVGGNPEWTGIRPAREKRH